MNEWLNHVQRIGLSCLDSSDLSGINGYHHVFCALLQTHMLRFKNVLWMDDIDTLFLS